MESSDDLERKDWIADLVYLAAGEIRDRYSHALTLIVPQNDLTLPEEIPQLSLLLELTAEQTPAICVIHGGYESHVCFEGEITRDTLTLDLLILWTRY